MAVLQSTIYLCDTQVAERLGISRVTVQKWRQRRIGPPYIKLGKTVRYEAAQLEAWIKSNTIDESGAAS